MKILQERYPKGTLKGQKSDGRYIDGFLFENIGIMAKKITDDMTFLGIITSSTLEVGTGKSVFAQQIGEAYLEQVRQHHKMDNRITMGNICFRPEELIEKAFKVPKYSVIILDEWEDSSYWSKLGITLRQFFRKCRQLNLFMIAIIPNFFQLPKGYAISRSAFLIDVKFSGEFERGYFDFYNFQKKKDLYIKGKREENYNVVKPNFSGRFADGYVVDEKQYRAAKLKDMMDYDEDKKKVPTEKEIRIKIFKQLRENLPDITIKKLSKGFQIGESTAYEWLKDDKAEIEPPVAPPSPALQQYYINPTREEQQTQGKKVKNIIAPLTK